MDLNEKKTELLALAAGMLVSVLNKKLGLDIDPTTMATLLGSVVVYIVQRGWVKVRKLTTAAPAAPALPVFTMTPETAKSLGLVPKE